MLMRPKCWGTIQIVVDIHLTKSERMLLQPRLLEAQKVLKAVAEGMEPEALRINNVPRELWILCIKRERNATKLQGICLPRCRALVRWYYCFFFHVRLQPAVAHDEIESTI